MTRLNIKCGKLEKQHFSKLETSCINKKLTATEFAMCRWSSFIRDF